MIYGDDSNYSAEISTSSELTDLRAENAELRAELADDDRVFAEGAEAMRAAIARVIVLEQTVAAQQQLLHLADAIISGGEARELWERLVVGAA